MKKLGVLGAVLISFGTGLYVGTNRKDSYEGVKAYLVHNPEMSDRLAYDSIMVANRNDISFSDRTVNSMADVLEIPRENRGFVHEADEFLQGFKDTEVYRAFNRFERKMEGLVNE